MWGKVAIISLLVLVIAYYFRWSRQVVVRDGKLIQTNSGPVKGSILVSRDGRDYYAWHKIPFAKPPLGDLRFADPLPVDKWTAVIDGREWGPECAQISFMKYISGVEDCLHLNVFAPKQLHDNMIEGEKSKHPVIVFFHGGGYAMGSSKMGGAGYLMDEDVVYVSLQYRLDILGFLTTGDKIARGNQGLKDQNMALKWIQDNIQHFGGDPNQITIVGCSAGAGSVHHHMLSPRSKGLFQRVFAESGAASCFWNAMPVERSVQKTKTYAQGLACPSSGSQQIVDCLRKLDLNTLLTPQIKHFTDENVVWNPQMYGEGFVPIIEAVKDEHAFVAEPPLKIISDGKAHRVPLLIGQATHEGLMTCAAFKRDPSILAKFKAELVPALEVIFGIQNPNVEEIVGKIKNFYFPEGEELDAEEEFKRYVDLIGDGFFNFDIREAVRLQRSFSPVYYYVHNKTDVPDNFWIFTEITGKWPVMLELGLGALKVFVKQNILGITLPFYGVGHGADFGYFFPMEEFGVFIRKEDKLYSYSKDLVKMLVEFAKDDESKMEFRGVKMQPVPSEGTLTVLEFKNEEVVVRPEPFAARMEFLQSLNIRSQ